MRLHGVVDNTVNKYYILCALYYIALDIDFLRNKAIEIDLSQSILATSGKPHTPVKCKNVRFDC
ncbi:hypothetical protein OA40_13445 [Morganella morganii]|nr:hypothetical protein OA40_13445 [Morganella morganii]HAE78675.1 hypothetical protein [Morganella sp. (in: enterobacteria)]